MIYNHGMIPLFLGLQIANHLLLLIVFGTGLWFSEVQGGPWAAEAGESGLYGFHVATGIAAGLFCAMAHVAVYMYFMATYKWLWAATEKAGLDPQRYVAPAKRRKSQSFPVVMGAIVMTMAAMFAGAGADPSGGAWWPRQAHLIVAAAAIGANLIAALREFVLIRQQQHLMDDALAVLNQNPHVQVQHA
jgi:hypothetical protein